MKDLREFNIAFVGLKEGKHHFEYQIDKTFFEVFNFDEFQNAEVSVTVDFVKKSTLLELNFFAKGFVTVPCDTTAVVYNQEIDTSLPLIVKFGEEFNDENEEILILPHAEYQVNVAQYIYEMIVLGVPSKRIHPDVLNGTMESKTLEKLRVLEINKEESASNADPRWDKLKELLTEKKT